MQLLKKSAFILAFIASFSLAATAQDTSQTDQYKVLKQNRGVTSRNITQKRIPLNATTTFVSPEKIKYVDISTKHAHGDLEGDNIFRLKVDSSAYANGGSFQVTIVTSSYVAIYKLYPIHQNAVFGIKRSNPGYIESNKEAISYVITMNPNNAVQINQHDALSKQQCFDLALKAMDKKKGIKNIKAKQYGLVAQIDNIFVVGDYLLFDLTIKNKRNLQFDIDQIRWKIIDKRMVKATVSQDIELHPIYQLYKDEGTIVKNKWENFYILKKFTYPTEKYLDIEITEKQISGRKIDLKIDYSQILKASVLM
ncbi:MAG TPA: conjugative transposon protein TraN [Chitinophagaceae bacterium]|nr:conjugative transposon protein TraN [Chitinophagaceae bacterium]